MIITAQSKSVIPFRPGDAKRVGSGCFYLDLIVWLNGESIELGDEVGFNYGCYVNGFGGLSIGDRSIFGPYTMIHTANHGMDDPDAPIQAQGWITSPVTVGDECWIGMGTAILPGVTIGDGVVIGAGSVVVKDLPSHSVAVGNPCKVIKSRK
ncbi:MAG: acyltransferase [Thermoleophilia bacterium]|nr:acyltransferase [Thermoleophilia bacterium]